MELLERFLTLQKIITVKWMVDIFVQCRSSYVHAYFSIKLMKDIVSSPFLYVMQVEIDIYTLLKKVVILFLFLFHI